MAVVQRIWKARAMRTRLLVAALTSGLLALPAPAAHATLVYSTFTKTSAKVHVAADDGTGSRVLASNANTPRISPDGQNVAYVSHPFSDSPEVQIIPTAGGTPRQVIDHWSYGILAWSPDGTHLVANAGGLRGKQRLKLIDVATGTARTVARGFFGNATFSPDGTQLAYDLSKKQEAFPKVDLYAAPVAGGAPRRLTRNGHSLFPLWGPTRIAYTRYARAKRKHPEQDSPKDNLSLLDPATGMSTKLTNDAVPYLLAGLTPAVWSADGTKLLAQFSGQDTVYTVTVDPATGTERVVGKKTQGIIPYGLSQDGSTILAVTSQVESADGDIVTAAYAGGPTTVLIKHGNEPDWTR